MVVKEGAQKPQRGSIFSAISLGSGGKHDDHHEPPGGAPHNHVKMMPDRKEMKESIRKNLLKPKYDVTNFYWETGFCQKIARHHIFENVTLSIIGINAIWISIDADLNTSDVLPQAEPQFIIAENLFCAYFFFEISIRFGSFKEKKNCLRDAWFCFDFFMVVLMVFETWVMSIVFLAMGGSSGVNLGSAAMVKMLRLLRLSRMARMVRLLRSMPEILILLKGISAAIRSVFFTLVLLIILLYIFAVLFRQLADGTPTGDEYFTTVPRSMNKLMIYGIFFDNFGEIVTSIVDEGQAVILLFFFYSFVLLASLTVINMLIGVLCEVVSAVAETEKEELTMIYLRDSLWGFVKDKPELHHEVSEGEAGDGFNVIITKSVFTEMLKDDKSGFVELLKEVEVDVMALVDLVDTIFSTDHGEEKHLTFPDFVTVMLEHRENTEATVKDITDLRRYIRARVDRMDLDMAAKLKRMQAHVNAMSTMIEKIAGVETGTLEEEAKENLEKLEAKLEKEAQAQAPQKNVARLQAKRMKLNNRTEAQLQQDAGPPGRTWNKMASTTDSPKVTVKPPSKDPGSSSNDNSSGRESKVSDSKKSKTPSFISDTE